MQASNRVRAGVGNSREDGEGGVGTRQADELAVLEVDEQSMGREKIRPEDGAGHLCQQEIVTDMQCPET